MLNSKQILREFMPENEIYNMINVDRFSTRSILHKENVAAHSFFVSYLGLAIGKKCGLKELELLKLLRMCLAHDVVESVTGDIISPIKESNKAFLEGYEELELKIVRENFPEVAEDFEILKKEEKERSLVYLIFKLCDVSSVVMFAEEEFELGNRGLVMQNIHNKAVDKCVALWEEIKKVMSTTEEVKKGEHDLATFLEYFS